MKVAQINNSLTGSIGKIIVEINKVLDQHHIDHHTYLSDGKTTESISIFSSPYYRKANALLTKINGRYGFECKLATKHLIKSLKADRPDVILIHNIHGHDVDLPTFFAGLNELNCKVFWLFHDCWAFTGGCAYPKTCENWKTTCKDCPQIRKYSYFIDSSTRNFESKHHIFANSNFTIITPSNWLKSLVKQSILSDHEVQVIHNGIDTSMYFPGNSNFKRDYNIDGKTMLLTIANRLSPLKGLHDYLKLASQLSSQYQLVMIGENSEHIDFPANITHIPRTSNKQALIDAYRAADIFVNLTTADNFPSVNLEAQSCGTPVITYDIGGCKETLVSQYSTAVPYNDLSGVLTTIQRSPVKTPLIEQTLHDEIKIKFDSSIQFEKYVDLFLH